MKDEEKTREQLVDELAELRRRIAELRATGSGRKKIEMAILESRVWLPIAAMFFLLCIAAWLDEVLDLPHLLLGVPYTPVNWGEAIIETIMIAGVGLFVVLRLIHDITERKRVEAERESLLAAEHEQRLLAETLAKVALVLTSQAGYEAVLDEILRQAQRIVPYSTAHIVLLEHGSLRIARWQGYEAFGSEDFIAGLVQSLADYPLDAQVVQSREPVVVFDGRQEPRWVVDEGTAWVKAHLVVPICLRDRVLGLLRLDSDTPGEFSIEDARRLRPLVNAAAIAIENARLYQDLQCRVEELRRTQTQLIQSAKMAAIGELAGGVAHELNNPLTAILGFAELLLMDTTADDPTRDDLKAIARQALRARDIVRRLLDFSRQTKFHQRRADVNEAVRETLALVRRQLEHSGIVLEENCATNLPFILLDTGHMKQVFLNLITNAIQAMPQGGGLTVTSERVGDEVAVRVADTGVGIPAEHLSRVFEPFFTTKPVGQGAGLGLSVSLGIIQEHGGRIEVESHAKEGSTFTVWLPVRNEDGQGDLKGDGEGPDWLAKSDATLRQSG